MHGSDDRSKGSGYTAQEANLRYLLNEWDPIGVADLVDDEYDCLLPQLARLLSVGATRAQFSEFLWFELEDHFGLDPTIRDVDRFADKLHALGQAWRVHDSDEPSEP